MVVDKVHVVVDVVVAEVGEVEVTSPTGKVDICDASKVMQSIFQFLNIRRGTLASYLPMTQ